ncbi:hypothetical protein [Paenibacillus sp. P32E]|uniref:hypothetical protein n=1 Tax=Paenibacillus sp. P32E TaxID=1349434 RepID=UPI00093FF908|nr:hypothetical protein [Paenibacillus sp. P32E]OKP94789.1 hypothetical protein A3848_02110 [Paenibacillus sp. P32E]
MDTSLNNQETIYEIPVKDVDTGEESTKEYRSADLIGAVVAQMRQGKVLIVIRDKLPLTPENLLVLEHEDLLQSIRDKINYLFINHNFGLGAYQISPERTKQRELERLLEREEPAWTAIIQSVYCAGCGTVLPGRTRVLRVNDGICCNYSCYGMMLAAKQPHGS